ncbi:MAG: sigma-54 dependent transcriptional regulator [Bacteroidia bacterium]|nr:sigma-54 dependent transcriptional regulator [Bacteroidia bacterium]
MPSVLIIDDERSIRNTIKDILEYENYEVDTAADGEEGLQKILAKQYDAVLCDVKMPKLDGLEVLSRAREAQPDVQFIMISGHANIETAVEATKKGAFDFIEKPPDLNRLLVALRNAQDKSHLVTETRVLKKKISKSHEIIGQSIAITKILETIERIAPTDARVLITGGNGTGKELVAHRIHEKSLRAHKHLVEVNCAAIPSELIESELFGHEKGSFTSAVKQRIGKFEQAHEGTLFLDEIGDMSLSAQAKVLRALQENKITRVGGEKDISVNVRVIAATNKDLRKEIERGNFREDLFHRLNVIPIQVPLLRERKEDIPILCQYFLNRICTEYTFQPKTFTPTAISILTALEWSGNIRELRNVIERLAILSEKEITENDIYTYVISKNEVVKTSTDSFFDKFTSFQSFKDAAEKEFIRRKLEKNSWNVTKTAEEIEVQRSHLYSKIEKYGFQRGADVENP